MYGEVYGIGVFEVVVEGVAAGVRVAHCYRIEAVFNIHRHV